MAETQITDISGDGRLLARIDERTKIIVEKIDQLCEDFDKRHDDHEERLRKLERNTWWRDGVAAAVGAVTGWIAGLQN
jgi:hypothetical protein